MLASVDDSPSPASAKAEHPTAPACVHALRKGVVERRAATWRWQDTIEAASGREIARFPTAHRARTATSCAYLRWVKRLWGKRASGLYQTWVNLRQPAVAICFVFGRYCSQAMAVAGCESGNDALPPHVVYASNGQYQGMFQMGSSERARFGHGTTPLEQARSAYAYFALAGYDWSPWSCKP